MSEGIDVGAVDEDQIDWGVLTASGRTFAFVRACYHLTPDKDFGAFWPEIKRAGLARGAYLFWDPRIDPQTQAQRFLEVVLAFGTLGAGDFPLAIDVEFNPPLNEMGLKPQAVLDSLSTTVATIECAIGTPPIIYTSRRVWIEDLQNIAAPALARCPLWVARYSPIEPQCPDPWGAGNWWFHQYAADARKVAGVSHQADLNRFNVLHEGAQGPRVQSVQRKLHIAATGTFDAATTDAVGRFQRDQGLRVDGVVGPLTWSRLVWEPDAATASNECLTIVNDALRTQSR
jgi:lysozyme